MEGHHISWKWRLVLDCHVGAFAAATADPDDRAIITTLWLKPMVARPRPYETWTDMVLLISRPSDFSFPSGHTCAAFACALILLWMLPRGQGIPFVILAALIGFSRLYLGVQYPSDVLGGFLVGTFSSLTVYGWYRLVMHFMHGGLM